MIFNCKDLRHTVEWKILDTCGTDGAYDLTYHMWHSLFFAIPCYQTLATLANARPSPILPFLSHVFGPLLQSYR